MEYSLTLVTRGSFIDQPVSPGPQYHAEVSTYRLGSGAADSLVFCAGDTLEERATAYEQSVVAEERLLEYLGLPFPGNMEGISVHIIRSRDIPNILAVAVVRQLTQPT